MALCQHVTVHLFLFLLANRIDELLHLTLRREEMEHIVAYLKTANNPLSHDLLVLHYLQQSRLTEASQLESTFTSLAVSSLFGTCASDVKFCLTSVNAVHCHACIIM